ncbi:MAG: FAD binding domain-containing protein [Pseudomonadota bacterium]
MHNFDFVKPDSLADATAAMQAEGAQALGGGQTLMPAMKQRLAAPDSLVSLAGVAEMIGVCEKDGALVIGGATTHAQVAADAAALFPGLAGLAGMIGDPAVRSRGTVGGSLANNDPAACYPAGALGTGATITTNTRDIAGDDFSTGMFDTALSEGEIITSVTFPIPEKSNYQKFEQPASRFALVGVFVAKYADGVRVAVTGASNGGVFRWTEAEAALTSNFSADVVNGMSPDASDMINDLHGSAAYRAHLVGVMTKRAVAACL